MTLNPAQIARRVVVGCKLPNGLQLHLDQMVEKTETTMGGHRTVMEAKRVGSRAFIRGNTTRFGIAPSWRIEGGYGLTENIDGEFMDDWMRQNARAPYVENNMVFVEPTMERAIARAKELTKTASGMEPMQRDGDVRAPKSLLSDNGQPKIEVVPADDRKVA